MTRKCKLIRLRFDDHAIVGLFVEINHKQVKVVEDRRIQWRKNDKVMVWVTSNKTGDISMI